MACSTPNRIAQRHPCGPRELTGSTLPPASAPLHRRARELRMVTAPQARPAHARRFRTAGRFSAGVGRQAEAQPEFWPALVTGHHAPWAVAPGQIGPETVRRLKIHFLIYLIPEILANFKILYRLVGMSINGKLNFVGLLLVRSKQWT
jgi:hypothetical protein